MVAARDSARPATEVELKLAFDPADAAEIASIPRSSKPRPPEEHELVSTCFDTPLRAHQAGVYLRIREIGGRYVQPSNPPGARPSFSSASNGSGRFPAARPISTARRGLRFSRC
jgi:hypothetical protein